MPRLREQGPCSGRRRSRHLGLLLAVAIRHHGVARRTGHERAGSSRLLSHFRPRHGPRHHIFLGRPHDHGGARVHGRTSRQGPSPRRRRDQATHSLRRRLLHRHHPGRQRSQDVEVTRQFARAARPDRQIWGRRSPPRHHEHRPERPGHPLRRGTRRARPQLLQQTVERLPFSPHVRRGP